MILLADLHLTDRPQDEYRWGVFDALDDLLKETGPTRVHILGDLGDKKDRHGSTLVNRVENRLLAIHKHAKRIDILMGNHDAPKAGGTPFWSMLNNTYRDGLTFITKPVFDEKLVLLPFTTNPVKDWAHIDWKKYKAAFMHQPVNGASSNGYKLSGYEMPLFPRGLKIYAGDIHEPQMVGKVTYVGAPHPINFGDDYKCRMLVLDDETFEIKREFFLHPPLKQLAVIDRLSDLEDYQLTQGDQLKIRMRIAAADMETWPKREAELIKWASSNGVQISSIEAVVQEQYEGQDVTYAGELDPLNLLAEYGQSVGLSDALMEVGVVCLERALRGGVDA